ncbi:MAG: mycothiol conjugate amidase Mca [Acidimicrobiales bacterium]
MSEPSSPLPCLLSVHAHPDDEASKGAGTIASYHARGVHTVLVCCTGGEQGDVLNPAMNTPEVRDRLPEIRREELARSAAIIGYDEVVMLGYRDSGMPGTEANANPACFARVPLDEAVERLVAVIRRVRPQVMVVYGDEQSGYPHPDHLRVHEVGVVAFGRAGDRDAFPGSGDPFQPSKLYYTVASVARFRAVHQKFVELGLESPFDEAWRTRWESIPEEPVSASIDVTEFADVRRRALLAHATQVDPNSPFWFGLPPEVMRTIEPHDDYRLARVAGPDGTVRAVTVAPDGPIEDDLFADLTAPARVRR